MKANPLLAHFIILSHVQWIIWWEIVLSPFCIVNFMFRSLLSDKIHREDYIVSSLLLEVDDLDLKLTVQNMIDLLVWLRGWGHPEGVREFQVSKPKLWNYPTYWLCVLMESSFCLLSNYNKVNMIPWFLSTQNWHAHKTPHSTLK